MTVKEIWDNAREIMAPDCRVCKECNGVACRGEVPGVGAAGDASSWTACMDFLKRVKLNMDTIYEYHGTDTTMSMFGRDWKYPLFSAPIGVTINTNKALTETEYAMRVVKGSAMAGVLPFTGDGHPDLRNSGLEAGKAGDGVFVPILKPWKSDIFAELMKDVRKASPLAVGMDIDAAGFVNLGKDRGNVCPRSVAELRQIITEAGLPFVLKGILTAEGAKKAADAGAYAIVVSSHGGRVIQSAPSTCSVLPEIRAAVGSDLKIIVDGGIRSGADVFKAIALGADAAMIGRPVMIAAHGGGAEGVCTYLQDIGAQLTNVMLLCGAATVKDITSEKIRID